jgi:hypothetical protein
MRKLILKASRGEAIIEGDNVEATMRVRFSFWKEIALGVGPVVFQNEDVAPSAGQRGECLA